MDCNGFIVVRTLVNNPQLSVTLIHFTRQNKQKGLKMNIDVCLPTNGYRVVSMYSCQCLESLYCISS